MQKKFIITLITLLFIISASCQAHTVADDNPKMQKKALAVINKVESFMKTNYNISLRSNVTIINTYNYTKTITDYKLQDIQYALEHSAAVSVPQRNLIILNMNIVTPEAYDFFLTHELVHKYQNLQAAFDGNNVNNHIGILEGIADDIAQKLTKITLSCEDQKIPFSEIASPKDFKTPTSNTVTSRSMNSAGITQKSISKKAKSYTTQNKKTGLHTQSRTSSSLGQFLFYR